VDITSPSVTSPATVAHTLYRVLNHGELIHLEQMFIADVIFQAVHNNGNATDKITHAVSSGLFCITFIKLFKLSNIA